MTKSNFRSVIRRHVRQNPNVPGLASTPSATGKKQLPNSILLCLPQPELQKVKEVEEVIRNGKSSQHPKFTDWREAIESGIFFNRAAELATLEQWIVQDRCSLVVLLGMGGIGKTALNSQVCRTESRLL